MRRGAVAVASLILMLGLAVGFYLGRRHSNAQLATPTTSSSLQSKLTPQAPSPPAGPHDRPVPILMYHVVGPTPPSGTAWPLREPRGLRFPASVAGADGVPRRHARRRRPLLERRGQAPEQADRPLFRRRLP